MSLLLNHGTERQAGYVLLLRTPTQTANVDRLNTRWGFGTFDFDEQGESVPVIVEAVRITVR